VVVAVQLHEDPSPQESSFEHVHAPVTLTSGSPENALHVEMVYVRPAMTLKLYDRMQIEPLFPFEPLPENPDAQTLVHAEQTPLEHDDPDPQALPQRPQCTLLVAVLTQAPLHKVVPVGQAHAPREQVEPVAQVTPQDPQWALLLRRSTQAAPQSVSPDAQAQVPATQLRPVVQAFPHAPQCALLLLVLTQVPPQRVCPAGQVHAPATQVCPEPQTLPQRPQCRVLVDSETSQPLPAN